MALFTLKTSMTIEVESMFNKFLEGLKLSTSPLKVGDATDKVTHANSYKGELLVKRILLLVVEMAPTSLPMCNLHLSMVDRSLPLI